MDRHWAKVPTVELGIAAVTEGRRVAGSATRLRAVASHVEQYLVGATISPQDSEAAEEYGQLRSARGRLMGGSHTMMAAPARALGLLRIANHRAFGRIKRLKTKDRTE